MTRETLKCGCVLNKGVFEGWTHVCAKHEAEWKRRNAERKEKAQGKSLRKDT